MQEEFQIQITEGSHIFIMDSDSGASIVDRDRLGDIRENEAVGSVGFNYDGQDWTAMRLAAFWTLIAGTGARQFLSRENPERRSSS